MTTLKAIVVSLLFLTLSTTVLADEHQCFEKANDLKVISNIHYNSSHALRQIDSVDEFHHFWLQTKLFLINLPSFPEYMKDVRDGRKSD